MKSETITDNLIQLTRYRLVNAYLVREDDGFTLIDTTMPKTGAAMIEAPVRRAARSSGSP